MGGAIGRQEKILMARTNGRMGGLERSLVAQGFQAKTRCPQQELLLEGGKGTGLGYPYGFFQHWGSILGRGNAHAPEDQEYTVEG